MKLLFDQNLSRHLGQLLSVDFPGSEHLSGLGLERADDTIVWERAKRDGFLIASKDTDFLHLALSRGHPPKIVYLEIGNCSTDAILRLIKDSVKRIEEFSEDPMQSFLILRPKSTP